MVENSRQDQFYQALSTIEDLDVVVVDRIKSFYLRCEHLESTNNTRTLIGLG